MKKMNKTARILLAVALVLCLTLALGITAFAAENAATNAVSATTEDNGWYWEGNTLYVYQGKIIKGELYNALVEKLTVVDTLHLFNFVPFTQPELMQTMVATFVAAGLFVGVVGSWTSIRKFMDV